MCSGSGVGSYLRLTDFAYHSTPGSRIIKKKKIKRFRKVLLQAVASVVAQGLEF